MPSHRSSVAREHAQGTTGLFALSLQRICVWSVGSSQHPGTGWVVKAIFSEGLEQGLLLKALVAMSLLWPPSCPLLTELLFLAHQKTLSLSKYSEAWLGLSFGANTRFDSKV